MKGASLTPARLEWTDLIPWGTILWNTIGKRVWAAIKARRRPPPIRLVIARDTVGMDVVVWHGTETTTKSEPTSYSASRSPSR